MYVEFGLLKTLQNKARCNIELIFVTEKPLKKIAGKFDAFGNICILCRRQTLCAVIVHVHGDLVHRVHVRFSQ